MEITNATVALAALGQTTRLAVFRLLVEAGPSGRMAGEIAEALGLPDPELLRWRHGAMRACRTVRP